MLEDLSFVVTKSFVDCSRKTPIESGTSITVNGIAIQKEFIGHLPQVNSVKIGKSKKWSIKVFMDKTYLCDTGCKTDTPQSI